jgi:hypothetical protein
VGGRGWLGRRFEAEQETGVGVQKNGGGELVCQPVSGIWANLAATGSHTAWGDARGARRGVGICAELTYVTDVGKDCTVGIGLLGEAVG